MKKIFYVSLTVLALSFSSFLIACHNGNAGTADLSHMYNTLHAPKAQAEFADALFNRHHSSGWLSSVIQEAEAAALPTSTGCPTIVGRHPQYYDIVTCNGVFAQVSSAPTASDQSFLLSPQEGQWQVFYETPDCSVPQGGNAWVRQSAGIGGTDLVQGYAIFVDMHFTGPTDAGNYLYVAPNATLSGTVNIQSFFDGNSCQLSSSTQDHLYPLSPIPADGTGVGWPAAPVDGPVFIGPAG